MEPSPARTPLVPPAGVTPEGTVPPPAPTPQTEATPLPPEPFADELPPDFWGDTLAPPDTLQAAPDDLQAFDTPPRHTTKPLSGTLQSDPRFVLLTELFPGRISDWQSADAPVGAATGGAADEGTDDGSGEPETVDLEEGLDMGETSHAP